MDSTFRPKSLNPDPPQQHPKQGFETTPSDGARLGGPCRLHTRRARSSSPTTDHNEAFLDNYTRRIIEMKRCPGSGGLALGLTILSASRFSKCNNFRVLCFCLQLHVPASQRVDSTRILTAEDFEKIKQLKRQAAHGEVVAPAFLFGPSLQSVVFLDVTTLTAVTWSSDAITVHTTRVCESELAGGYRSRGLTQSPSLKACLRFVVLFFHSAFTRCAGEVRWGPQRSSTDPTFSSCEVQKKE